MKGTRDQAMHQSRAMTSVMHAVLPCMHGVGSRAGTS
jgi:hypothetical protein